MASLSAPLTSSPISFLLYESESIDDIINWTSLATRPSTASMVSSLSCLPLRKSSSCRALTGLRSTAVKAILVSPVELDRHKAAPTIGKSMLPRLADFLYVENPSDGLLRYDNLGQDFTRLQVERGFAHPGEDALQRNLL